MYNVPNILLFKGYVIVNFHSILLVLLLILIMSEHSSMWSGHSVKEDSTECKELSTEQQMDDLTIQMLRDWVNADKIIKNTRQILSILDNLKCDTFKLLPSKSSILNVLKNDKLVIELSSLLRLQASCNKYKDSSDVIQELQDLCEPNYEYLSRNATILAKLKQLYSSDKTTKQLEEYKTNLIIQKQEAEQAQSDYDKINTKLQTSEANNAHRCNEISNFKKELRQLKNINNYPDNDRLLEENRQLQEKLTSLTQKYDELMDNSNEKIQHFQQRCDQITRAKESEIIGLRDTIKNNQFEMQKQREHIDDLISNSFHVKIHKETELKEYRKLMANIKTEITNTMEDMKTFYYRDHLQSIKDLIALKNVFLIRSNEMESKLMQFAGDVIESVGGSYVPNTNVTGSEIYEEAKNLLRGCKINLKKVANVLLFCENNNIQLFEDYGKYNLDQFVDFGSYDNILEREIGFIEEKINVEDDGNDKFDIYKYEPSNSKNWAGVFSDRSSYGDRKYGGFGGARGCSNSITNFATFGAYKPDQRYSNRGGYKPGQRYNSRGGYKPDHDSLN